MANLGNLIVYIKSDAGKFIRDIKLSKKHTKDFKSFVDRSGASLGRFASRLTAAGGAAAVLGASLSIKEAAQFEKALAEVSTLLDDTSGLKGMAAEVKLLSKEYGTFPTSNVKALYQIISAGATSSAEAMDLLTVSNKLALGGVTDVEVAADGLTTILNTYQEEAGGAAHVSDLLFTAMKAGKTTIGLLSGSIGKVAPLAVEAGVSLAELLAATSTITKGGIETSRAVAGLNQVLVSVVRPTSQARDLARLLGIEFDIASLQARKFSGFLEHVKEKTRGSSEALGLLFGSTEALTPALQLTGSGAETFNAILADMVDVTGETDTAVDKMSETTSQGFDRVKARATVLGIQIGDKLLPTINNFFEILESESETGALSVFEETLFSIQGTIFATSAVFTKFGLVLANFVADPFEEGKTDAGDFKKALEDNLETIYRSRFALDEERAALIARRKELARINELFQEVTVSAQKRTAADKKSVVTLADLGVNIDELGASTEDATDKNAEHVLSLKDQILALSRSSRENSILAEVRRLDADATSEQIQKTRTLAGELFDEKKRIEDNTASLEEQNEAVQDLGFTFSSAFEDAIVNGNRLRDVLKGILKDIIRIAVRKAITEPLGNALGSFFGSIGTGGSTLAPIDLSTIPARRAGGGLVSAGSPYIVGERSPELFVPHDSGRIIPDVTSRAGSSPSGGGVTITVNNYGNDPVDVVDRGTVDNDKQIDILIGKSLSRQISDNSLDKRLPVNHQMTRRG